MKNQIPSIKYKYTKDSDSKGFRIVTLDRLGTSASPFKNELLCDYHQIEFFAILIISDGEVRHLVDFEVANLKKGDCLIITKGQVHAFEKDASYNGYLLMFSEEFIQKHFTSSTVSKIPFLYQQNDQQLVFNNKENNQLLTKLLLNGLNNNTKVKANQIGALLSYYLLNLISEPTEQESLSRKQDYFFQFKKMVVDKHTSSRNAKDYALNLNISYKHLNDICKFMANRTAKALIDDFIILEAKRQLVLSSLTVKEIGFKLGFEEASNFRKYFNKHTGISPNEFIRKMQLVTH